MIDLHAHLLPALDDGPPTLDRSLDLCRDLVEEGVTRAVATPHMFDGVFEVPPAAVRRGVEALGRSLAEAGLPLEVLPGAEVRVDVRALEAARSGELLSLGGAGRHVLLELPRDILPPRIEWFLFDLQRAGLTPVLAHPELNAEIQTRVGILERLTRSGSLVQISASSLTGSAGESARTATVRMLRRGMVHFLASDCHDAVDRPPELRAALAEAARIVGEDEARAMVEDRPAAVLGDGLGAESGSRAERVAAGRRHGEAGLCPGEAGSRSSPARSTE